MSLLLCFGLDNCLWVTVDIEETYSYTWLNLFFHIYQGLFNEMLWASTQSTHLQLWLFSGLFPLVTSMDSSVFLLQMLVTYLRTPSDSTCLKYHFFHSFLLCVYIIVFKGLFKNIKIDIWNLLIEEILSIYEYSFILYTMRGYHDACKHYWTFKPRSLHFSPKIISIFYGENT